MCRLAVQFMVHSTYPRRDITWFRHLCGCVCLNACVGIHGSFVFLPQNLELLVMKRMITVRAALFSHPSVPARVAPVDQSRSSS